MRNIQRTRTNTLRIFLIRYGFHIVLLFFLVNLVTSYVIHFYILATGCMTRTQVASDSRCLYIVGTQIYQKDSRSSPHHGHPCGTDVTSIIPGSHLGNAGFYLVPNYIANVCPAVTSTPTPTRPPGATATPTPTPLPGSQIVTSFTLWNAQTNKAVQTIANGATINAGTLPLACMNIRANTTPSSVGSVVFGYDGNPSYHTENTAPYDLGGDSSIDNVTPNCWNLTMGSHTLIATPFTLANGTGTRGAGMTVSFNVGTSASTPTPTLASGTTTLSVSFCPHGLGNCGDNVSPIGGNTNPGHTLRNATVTILDGNNAIVQSTHGTVVYNSASNTFTGTIPLNPISSGHYLVILGMDGFLSKQAPGIVTITQGQNTTIPILSLVTGNTNNDSQLDLLDYNIIIGCFGTKYTDPALCTAQDAQLSPGADVNDDGVVDGTDYNLFVREQSIQKGF